MWAGAGRPRVAVVATLTVPERVVCPVHPCVASGLVLVRLEAHQGLRRQDRHAVRGQRPVRLARAAACMCQGGQGEGWAFVQTRKPVAEGSTPWGGGRWCHIAPLRCVSVCWWRHSFDWSAPLTPGRSAREGRSLAAGRDVRCGGYWAEARRRAASAVASCRAGGCEVRGDSGLPLVWAAIDVAAS